MRTQPPARRRRVDVTAMLTSLAMAAITAPLPAYASEAAQPAPEEKAAGSSSDSAARTAPVENATGPTRAILFRVTDSAQNELWLLGSIHLADQSIYPLPDSVERAFAASQVLAVEADVVTTNPMALQSQMMSAATDPERGLSRRLPDDLREQTASRLAAFGLDIRMFEHTRPWFVAMMLTNLAALQTGISPDHGIEHHFIRRAADRPIVELEGVARQLQVFGGLSEEMEVLFLRQALIDSRDIETQIETIVRAYRTGDLEAMEELRRKSREEHPGLASIDEILFTKRNEEMASKIRGYLADERVHFVIVGAGHLAGDDSIVALLEAKGLTVERR